ncbi:MAG: hypothetical protein A2Z34_05600 [Planctomycetes bacterium RBG_16_59_8]|nr:MAG: hypothetical protein A2Z34_05600 [Planctomycetes bacterium RBG_16_59_8]
MAIKKPPEEHENHERWMVSYADFLTLMFAFFVVMYSVSSLNEGKYRVMAESISSAFTKTDSPARGKSDQPVKIKLRDMIDNAKARGREGHYARKEIQQIRGWATLVQRLDDGGWILTLGGQQPFDPGEFVLKKAHSDVLNEIKEALLGKKNVVEVCGYTSGLPEDSLVWENGTLRKYAASDKKSSADHWILSYMRAKAVADYLLYGPEPRVDVSQIKLLALANTDPEVREQHPKDEAHAKENRRVAVKITNEAVK